MIERMKTLSLMILLIPRLIRSDQCLFVLFGDICKCEFNCLRSYLYIG